MQNLTDDLKSVGGIIYLASPYTHPDADIRVRRFEEAIDASAWLMQKGLLVYSPIAHCHPIAVRHNFKTTWENWEQFCGAMVNACSVMVILMSDGWESSVGIRAERCLFQVVMKPILFLDPAMVKD